MSKYSRKQIITFIGRTYRYDPNACGHLASAISIVCRQNPEVSAYVENLEENGTSRQRSRFYNEIKKYR
jgi:hypothetical protein